MPITSPNQNINVRFGSEVTSVGVNKRVKDVFGSRGKLTGLNLSPVSGLNCALSAGKFILDGATIEEQDTIAVPIPANNSGVPKSYYVYAFYTHADEAECTYDVLEATTPSETALLLATVTIPHGTVTITTGHIVNELAASLSKDAVVFSNKTAKQVEAVNRLTVGSVNILAGASTPTGTSEITVDGYLTATRVYNPFLTDYAEYFERGEATEPGDIIALDMFSTKEQYVKASQENFSVIGVHTTAPAQIIGGDGDRETVEERFIPVAVAGRVPVKVAGNVKRGDYIILSLTPGVGRSASRNVPANAFRKVVGIAVEDKNSLGIELVRCFVTKL